MDISKTPSISIIIPVYNKEKHLAECLDSVINQTLRDIEIICINDGSTDGSLKILEEYRQKDERINIINQQNMGAAHSRNTAMKLATGEYMAFMDADDYYPENDVLESLHSAAVAQNAKVVLGTLIKLLEDGKIKNNRIGEFSGYYFDEDKKMQFSEHQFCSGFTRGIYKRDMLRDNNIEFPLYQVHEDPVFLCNTMICAGEFYALAKVVYVYRVIEKPISTWTEKKVLDCILGLKDILALSKEHNLEKVHFRAFNCLNYDYKSHVEIWLEKGSKALFSLLAEVNNVIDTSLLLNAKELVDEKIWQKRMEGFSPDRAVLVSALYRQPADDKKSSSPTAPPAPSSNKKHRILKYIFYIIAVASPFIMAELAARADGYTFSMIVPFFNDEAGYFLQIHSMLEFGAPLGNNGFNGSHAPISTFGFHGLGVLIPYFLFASIFGLQLYTIALTGLVMMSAAILFYILALRPGVKQLAFLVLCTSMGALLLHTNMMESGFYAYMIVLATLMIRIHRKNELSYKIAALVFMTFMSFVRPTFAPLMFPLLMLIVKTKRWYVNALISLFVMAVFTVVAYMAFLLFSAPYLFSHLAFELSDLRYDFIGTVSSVLSGMLHAFFYLLVQVARRQDIWGMYLAVLLYFTLFLLLYLSATQIVSYLKTKKFKDPKDTNLIFILTVTLIGYIILETGILTPHGGQTLKNILPIILFMSIMISAMEIRKKSHFISLFAIVGAIIIVFSGWIGFGGHKPYATDEFMARVETVERFYEESVVISPEKSRWENTIASYIISAPDFYWLNAPAGTGWNIYLPGRRIRSAYEKYVLIPHINYYVVEYYLDAGYIEINSSETVVLLLNPKYLP